MNSRIIIISRTDGIGDVVLTLPVAGYLKRYIPSLKIIFLGRKYTQPVIESCEYVDKFIDWDTYEAMDEKTRIAKFKEIGADTILHVFPDKAVAKVAYKANVRNRIGTTNRIYHWLYCNKLVRLSRRKSRFHEAQLNLKLLNCFGIPTDLVLNKFNDLFGITRLEPLKDEFTSLLSKDKFNVIFHPKSKGNGREWGIENFANLAHILDADKFNIFITGTDQEAKMIGNAFENKNTNITDLTGKLSLKELISFIAHADGMVASSTGPLHVAGALNKFTVGIYAPVKPMHPGRWAALGHNTKIFVNNKNCILCLKNNDCECIKSIMPADVKQELLQMAARK